MKNKIRQAFTLAEAIIVIALIGVIAAATIPNLMTNLKIIKKRAVLNKVLGELNQANRMARGKYDYDFSSGAYASYTPNLASENKKCSEQTLDSDYMTYCAIFNSTMHGFIYIMGDEVPPEEDSPLIIQMPSGAYIGVLGGVYNGQNAQELPPKEYHFIIFPIDKISEQADILDKEPCTTKEDCKKSKYYTFITTNEGVIIPKTDAMREFMNSK